MGSKRRGPHVAGLVAGLCALATAAAAREHLLGLSIPEQAREAALLALGRAAGVSLGFTPDAHCGGRAGLTGRMTLDEGLARLLAGSACEAARPDARTIVIRARPVTRPGPAPPPAPAPIASYRSTQVGELVVTADKTETLLSSAPYGLTAASGAELARRGVADVRDLSLIAAGVTVTNLGPGRDKVLLRGLSDGPLTGHTQSTVGLYLGDLRLTYNAPDPDLPLLDVERVEVLRGPQGSLYGAGSIGGVVQVIPNPPDPMARTAKVAASVSATAGGSPSHGIDGVLNQPLLHGAAAVRIAAWSEVEGGYIDNPRLGRRDIDRSRRSGVRLSGRWHAGEDLTLDAMLVEQSIGTRNAHYAEPAVGDLARNATVGEPHDNDFLALALAARWTPDWGRLTVSVGALDHDVGTTYDATSAPADLVAPGAHPLRFKDGNEIRGIVSEARLSSSGPGRWHWTVGAFGAFGDQKLDQVLTPVEPAAGYLEVRRDRLRESAVFGEVSYDLTPVLTATVGGRLFESELKTHSQVSLGAPLRDFAGTTHDGGFAPKLLLALRPQAGLTLYAQVAEGYRTPGFNTAGPPGQDFTAQTGAQPFRRYGGDNLRSYEAGGRWRPANLGLAVRAAVFQANWTHIQADLVLPSGLPFTATLGDGRSRGVELEASYEHGGLSLTGNIVRQEPELRHAELGLPRRRDTGLPGAPDISYAAGAAYTASLNSRWRLDLASSYVFVGPSRLPFDAVTDPTMGHYGELRLSATVRSDDVSLRLFMNNSLDKRGDTLAFGNPFSFRTIGQTTPQRPREIGVRLEARY